MTLIWQFREKMSVCSDGLLYLFHFGFGVILNVFEARGMGDPYLPSASMQERTPGSHRSLLLPLHDTHLFLLQHYDSSHYKRQAAATHSHSISPFTKSNPTLSTPTKPSKSRSMNPYKFEIHVPIEEF